MDHNSVTLIGRATRDPELKAAGNTSVCNFSIAVNHRYKRGDEWAEECSFFDVVVFGKLAEAAAEFLSKGMPVLVVGRLKQETWDQNGQKRSAVKVIANLVQGLASGARNPDSQERPASRREESQAPPPSEDIPF